MIGVGTVIDHGNDELIAIRIVAHRPKVVRHHGGGGGCHRDRNCNQQEGAKVFQPVSPELYRYRLRGHTRSIGPTPAGKGAVSLDWIMIV